MGRRSLVALCSILVICGVFVAFMEDASDFSRSSIKVHAEDGKIMNKATKKLVSHIKTAFKKAMSKKSPSKAKKSPSKAKKSPSKGGRKVADKGVINDKDKKVVKKAMKKYVKTKKKVTKLTKKTGKTASWHRSLRRRRAKSRRRRRSSKSRRRPASKKKKTSKKSWGKVVKITKKAKKTGKKRMKKILKIVKQNKVRMAVPKHLWKGLNNKKIYRGLIKRDLVPAKVLSDPFNCDEEIDGKDCVYINSRGKNSDTGGIKGLPKIINGKVRPPGYTTDDAHTGPYGHYYIGESRRRIGAGFGRRRRTVDAHPVARSHHRILVHGGVAKKNRV